MSILRSILSPFIDFKNEPKQSGGEPPVEPPRATAAPVTVPQQTATEPKLNTPSSGPVSSAVSATQYHKHFEELIEQANTTNPIFQGTDFKEFIDSKADVEGIADEPTRYKTAFNVLKRAGLTREKLESTGRAYIKVIEQDLKAFNDVYIQQYKTNVEQKQQLLDLKTRELQALNDKINTLKTEIQQVDKGIAESREQLNNNKNAFVIAGENKKKEIEEELAKINQYFS